MSDCIGLTPDEVCVFARGLYYLAYHDGLDPREEKLIREFLAETKSDLTFESLTGSEFDPFDAAAVLHTSSQRQMFLRTAMALVMADGKFTAQERLLVGQIADVFGITNAQFGIIEYEARETEL